jgi:hypothetical protein
MPQASLYTKLNTFSRAALVLFPMFVFALDISAQVSGTGQLVGSVQDASGAAVPGAELHLENSDTKVAQTAVASNDGGFVFTTLPPGAYKLTASMKGFDTGVYNGIVINAARTTNQLVTLTVGAVNQTVEVTGSSPLLQVTSTTVANTVDQKALQDLPLSGRDTLPFALLSAGAQQGVTSRDSTFEGMPGAAINITLNGIANNAQRFKSGGTSFFAFVTPRLETVQEVTISTSNLGSDNSTGQGAMQMQYVSKSGSNSFHGEVFWQHSNSALNANDWFNNANRIKRPVFIQNDQGGTIGGRILKNRFFFFFSYAQRITPTSASYSALVLTPSAQNGNFSYVGTDGVTRTVNLLSLAGRNGFPGTVNPIVAAQLQKIQTATSAGSLSPSDLIRNQLKWSNSEPFTNYYPMGRLDYLITPNLRFNVSDTWARTVNAPGFRGTTLPGSFAQEQSYGQIANPYIATAGLTWTIKPNLLNDFNFGIQGTQETFNTGFNINTFLPRLMTFPLGLASGLEELNGLQQGNTFQARNNPVYNLYDNMKYQKGNHSWSFGGNWIHSYMHTSSLGAAGIPSFNFGVDPADSVNAIFNSSNLPSISNANLADATNLYALLTGRVSSVRIQRNVDAASHQFADFQPVFTNELQTSFGLYASDSWRISRSLTLNYGLRWDFQGDNQNPNNLYTSPTPLDLFGPSGALGGSQNTPNLFNPGSLTGVSNPAIYQRSKAYNADYVNPAPHIGIAWNPSFQNAWLATLFGDHKSVIRAGYSMNYYSEGMLSFTDLVGNNPGLSQRATLAPGVNFAPGSLSVGSTLPAYNLFPASFSFPLPLSNFAFGNQTVGSVDPNLKAPYVQTWSFGIQREIRQGSVVEVRYNGNHGVHLWHAYNQNEVNIFENGFLNQFQAAQKNLAANQANGRGNSFANNGLPGQVATPIFNSAFGNLSAGQGYGNTNFVNLLQSGQAGAMAYTMSQSSTYFCNMVGSSFSPCASRGFTSPGQYPINFFQLNPYVATANLLHSDSFSNYNALQIEFRQRSWHGLTLSANYSWSHSLTDRYSKTVDNIVNATTLRNRSLNFGPSPWDIRHVLTAYGTYDIPFGKGRRYSVSNAFVDAVAGGWTIGSIFRIQSGLPFELSSSQPGSNSQLGVGQYTVNQQDSGVIPKVSTSELQSNVGVYRGGNPYIYFINPKLIGGDGRANPSYLGLPTTAGQFGSFIYLYGPHFITDDLSITKAVPIFRERIRMEFRAEMVNAFNHPIFQVPTGGTFSINAINIAATSFARATTTTTMPRQVQFRLQFAF